MVCICASYISCYNPVERNGGDKIARSYKCVLISSLLLFLPTPILPPPLLLQLLTSTLTLMEWEWVYIVTGGGPCWTTLSPCWQHYYCLSSKIPVFSQTFVHGQRKDHGAHSLCMLSFLMTYNSTPLPFCPCVYISLSCCPSWFTWCTIQLHSQPPPNCL